MIIPRNPVSSTNLRAVQRVASRARASEAIAEHERRLFPAEATLNLIAIVDAMHARATQRGDGADVLERLDDAATELECALGDGTSAAHEAAEACHEIEVAIQRADEAIRMVGDLLEESDLVAMVAAKAKRP